MNVLSKINELSECFSSKLYCRKEIKDYLLALKKQIESDFCSDCDYIKQKVIDSLK